MLAMLCCLKVMLADHTVPASHAVPPDTHALIVVHCVLAMLCCLTVKLA